MLDTGVGVYDLPPMTSKSLKSVNGQKDHVTGKEGWTKELQAEAPFQAAALLQAEEQDHTDDR